MTLDGLIGLLLGFNVVVLVYLALLNLAYLTTGILAFRHTRRHVVRLETLDLDRMVAGADTLPMSLIVPAYNEEGTIVGAVRSFLSLRYPDYEVIVVNDGSSDGTMDRLLGAFDMERAHRFPSSDLTTAPVQGLYRSRRHSGLWLIDKHNGGKADALNAGLNYCRTPVFCAIDADTMLEPESLSRAVRPFLEDARTVATGGIIRVANGCTIRNGLIDEVHIPRNLIARIQVLEYLRAFLSARMGWDALDSTLIISGAFGAFRRSVVAAAGGYSSGTVAEDMELVVRLHRYCRENAIPYRVSFSPDPIAWTECPEDLVSLGNQRERWQRGLAQVLAKHRAMLLNRRFGRPSLLGYSYYALFELIGPVLEGLGYLGFLLAVALGVASWPYMAAFFVLAFVLGMGFNFGAVGLEELSFRRYSAGGDFRRLLLVGVVEVFGYRQLNTWWRLRGLWTFSRGERGWGSIRRTGFKDEVLGSRS